MSELLDLARVWPELLVAILLFGFAPGFCLRLIVLLYPRGHDRRRELMAELHEVPYVKKPIWVASQLETALFEGVAARISELRRRLRSKKKGNRVEEELEPAKPIKRPPLSLPAGIAFTEGAVFRSRHELRASGIHRALQAGIVGTPRRGAESIVVGESADLLTGDFIVYTGHGGRDSRGAQVADQTFEAPGNAALYTSWQSKRPVRVVRHGGPSCPQVPSGSVEYHYDGYYSVIGAWSETVSAGWQVCRFALVRCGSPAELRHRAQTTG
ncbi:YDG/SRA domain-containing protein [Amycolatopsis sp. NPDC004169]|uniref:YDG/SRA domain-containing protein n=1 Tax=Amycolatopsis sp. NPDC004169 TaxID=3154453 RepID=UPI0033AA9E40